MNLRVCYIEDMELEAENIQRLVATSGAFDGVFEFRVFGTWAEGSAAIAAEPFDLVLLDLGLPDSLTKETVPKIGKMRHIWPPTAVLTGSEYDNDLRSRCLMLGAEDFITKKSAHRDPVGLCERLYNAYWRRQRDIAIPLL